MFKNLSLGAVGVHADLAGALVLAKAHGFAGIEFNIIEAAELAARHGIDHVQHMFAEAGIVPGNFGFPVDFRKDEGTWRAGLEALPHLAKVAQGLGATRTATWILPFSDERPFAENFRWHIERLRPAAQILADHGIRLGFEFVGPATARAGHRYGFLHSLDGMLALCAAIGTDNLGLLLDSYHWHTSHGNLDDLAKLSGADVVVVHVNDALPGVPVDELQDLIRAFPCETGVINLAGFMQVLARIGYDGPVIVEPFSQRVREMLPDEAVHVTAESLRRLWAIAGLESA